MSNAFLIGPRVQLRRMEEADAGAYAEWINDPEMRRHLTVRFPLSLKDEKDWIASLSEKGTPRNVVLAIERRSDSRLIGSVGLHQIDWVSRRATTGCFICPASLRGKGYGTEAKTLLIDYAFGELGLHSLWALAVATNVPSLRALEKQGYRRSGIFREAALVKGAWQDLIYVDLLKDDWARLRRAGPPAGGRSRGSGPRIQKRGRTAPRQIRGRGRKVGGRPRGRS